MSGKRAKANRRAAAQQAEQAKKQVPIARRGFIAAVAAAAAGTALYGFSPGIRGRVDRTLAPAFSKIIVPLERRRRLKLGAMFSRNFLESRSALDAFLRERAQEVAKIAGQKSVELGGVVLLSNGKPRMLWFKDEEEVRIRAACNLLRRGNLQAIPIKEIDFLVEWFQRNSKHLNRNNAEKFYSALNAARKRVENAQKGIESQTLSRQETELFSNVAETFEEMSKYSFSALRYAHELDKNPNNRVLATFHSHPFPGAAPKGEDVSNSQFIPEIVFSFEQGKMNAYYIVNQRSELAFSVPWQRK